MSDAPSPRLDPTRTLTARDALVPWTTPELTGINRLRGRAFLAPFASADDALANTAPVVHSLDGTWKFQILDRPEDTPADFPAPDLDDRGWADIAVPGCWTMQGFGKPWYTNFRMPWSARYPQVPERNPTGLYRTHFAVPKEWTGKRLVLRFGSIESVGSVWVNGVAIGLSKDSRLPSEFDITAAAKPGDNLLAVQVIQWSDCSFIEDQDQWWQAGIARDVELLAYPAVHIEDVFAKAGYDHVSGAGALDLFVRVHATPAKGWKIHARVVDHRGRNARKKPLIGEVGWSEPTEPHGFEEHCVKLNASLPKVEPWSHESPTLYTLVVSLVDPEGRAVDHARQRIGFRTVAIKDRSLLLNGARVFIRGANRHEHHERTGKALDRATMRRDIQVLKQFNFNAVRTSHYPPDPHWFDLCDEHGILCIDETNIEAHHHNADICHDPRYAAAFLDRGSRMVLRDRNHPSIIIWSLGNETGYGPNHDAMAAWMRHADGSRVMHYEGAIAVAGWDNGHAGSDLVCPMYPAPEQLVKWATTTKDWRPLIMCEYAHAMGNSCGGLADYWQAFENTPGMQGGFIWELLDHGIRKRVGGEFPVGAGGKPDKRSPAIGWPGDQEFWAYGGDFGETVHDTNFVCDGLLWPDRTPHTPMWEAKTLFQPLAVRLIDGAKRTVEVRSKYHFISTAHLVGTWSLSVDGVDVEAGKLPQLDLKPGQSIRLRIRCSVPRTAPGQELHLTLRWVDRRDLPLTGKNHEVAWAQAVLPTAKTAAAPRVVRSRARLAIDEGRSAITIRGDGLEVALDRASGRLNAWTAGGIDLLKAGPAPCVWRAPTDNDGIRMWDMRRDQPANAWENKPLRRWLIAGLDQTQTTVERVSTRATAGGAEVVLRTRTWGTDKAVAIVAEHRLRATADGVLAWSHRFDVDKRLPDLARIGVHLLLPAGFEQLEWLGLGPHETYSDRRACGQVGRWTSTVTDQYAPHIMPQEHGHHCDVRWLSLRRADGAGLLVSAQGLLEFNASHCDAHDLTAARHTTDVRFHPEVHLNLDATHRGLGTQSCGPDTFEQYRVHPGKRYRLAYRLVPLAPGMDASAAHRVI